MTASVFAMTIAAFHAELSYRYDRWGLEADCRNSARWAMVLSACATASVLDRVLSCGSLG